MTKPPGKPSAADAPAPPRASPPCRRCSRASRARTTAETVIDQFVRHRLGALAGADGFEDGRVPDAHAPLFMRIVRAVVQGQDELDRAIAETLPADWPMARLDPVLRAMLRAGAAELTMQDGPPARVVINEYLDVAHGFFTGEEPRMVNGMLDSLARQLRPKEFEPA